MRVISHLRITFANVLDQQSYTQDKQRFEEKLTAIALLSEIS